MSVRTTARRTLDLATVLVGRDLRLSYGSAALGLLWAPATVLVQVVVLSFVFVRVVPLGVDDYPAFVFSGLAAWQLLSAVIGGAAAAYPTNRDLVRRPGFPDAVLPLVTTGRAIAAYGLGLPVLLAVLAATGRLDASAVALPLVVAAAVLAVLGPAFLLAAWNVRHRDVDHLARVVLGVAFYATPVFYAARQLPGGYRWLADANPLAVAVTLHRQVLYDGRWPDPARVLLLLGFAVVGLAAAVVVQRRVAPHLADDL